MENDTLQLDRDTNEEAKEGAQSTQTGSKEKDVNRSIVEVEKGREKHSLHDPGMSTSNVQKSSSPSLPVPTSSSPPITSALWEPHGAPNAAPGGGGDGPAEQFSHPEVLTSSPGSDAENGAPDFLHPEMQFQTPVKGGSAHTDNAAMLETSLRHVLSDPVTGTFMNDAMVARCGHSFGSASLISVCETGKCMHCGASVPSDSLVPNYALRAAVQAFKREDHMWQSSSMKPGKRRREQSEQPEGSEGKRLARDTLLAGEQTSPLDSSRPRGVQFPFAASDRVLIKGNKRTPERFVGREAIITSQCLNGWYLVRTLDNGESVRLQYRSLQKLGDIDQHPESGSSPDETGSVKKTAIGSEPKVQPALSMTDDVLDGGKTDVRAGAAAYPALPVKGMRTESHKKPRKGDMTRSTAMAATSSTAGASSSSSLDMQSDAKMTSPSKVTEETRVIDHVDEDDPYDMKPTVSLPTVIEKAEVLIEKVEKGGAGGHLLERPQVWENLVEAKDLHKPHGIPEVESITEVVPTLESGDSFTVRSKRSALATRGPAAITGTESDPYRKVYASRSNRRGASGDGPVLEPPVTAVVVDSKPAEQIMGEGPKWVNADQPSGEKFMQEAIQMPNMKEILSIMRKDILNLEKQIPWNCLVKAWKLQRTDWRKGVKESTTVEELGAKVKAFRSSLLLTMAGGMTDEEWGKRLQVAMETDDVELLVSLWGRLYDDVYKWVQSKPKRVQGGVTDTNLVDTFAELRKQFPKLQVDGLSPVEITTAATLAAADAVAERHLDANALLAVPTKLLQQHSREDLHAVRESLGREKRHLAAKLSQLEANESRHKKEDLVAGFLAGTPTSGQVSMTSMPSATALSPQVDATGPNRQQQRDKDDGESDGVNNTHDADGEATDMSDSD